MSLEIGFGERLTNIVSLTTALTLLGKDANEARSTARDLEEEIRTKATSTEEYHQNLEKAIFALQRAKDSLQQEQGDSVEEIEILNHEGPSFGSYQYATFHADGLMSTVFKAEAKGNNAPVRIVALKVTHPSMMTPPHNSEREARLLVKARSEHVVPLLETFHEPGGQFILVFPFLRQDLENLLRSRRLDARQTAIIFEGLFKALEYIHSVGMIHRDVKPSNILLKTMYGPVYLADFGITWDPMDKDSEPADAKITDVGTTCYRPPELLFGHRLYDASLDMWAAGCVVAEMIKDDHTPLFDAGALGSELSLIRSMFTTLGTPNDEVWPSAQTYPDWGKMKFQPFPANPWKDLLPGASEKAVDLVSKTVCYEATQRLTAKQALEHEIRNNWNGPGD
ncbi:mitogen-activated protein kinase [Elasticomyces elasticus]|uniref:cyclin-dependent kinase n=1 Tax=Exophiala sideris TaxID=1016849 RepID=A0ABR0JQZ1_9EURO|nr:mitogen-activated protein kinase [Elasticomyces elasticus]KAK5034719.1 mitogen-activated protein kinase [Exophiala sideris]KAK5039958.1 mitogen-activated protein kinase [Exophiala sideris]KAK5068337.1 mitogen-activated protein kinase [Exophiala sideris]KAK5187638.1 mitogen-activated protein kinase [Eurotiomycetes sp. CCFEE 6388]